ncbi:hypothetical protein ACYUJ6_07670 [Clostridium sp. JNZ X4-2]
MSTFGSITPEELSLLANLVAFQLTEGKSADDNNVLGNFLTAVAADILVIAAQQESLESLREKQDQIKDLKKQIKDLK